MKKLIRNTLLLALSGWLLSGNALAQGTTSVKVISMPGFPSLPQDSAFEGQNYTFSVLVKNNTNTLINTPIDILLRVDSIESVLVSNPQPVFQPGDSLTLTISGFGFTPPQFKTGNNIVVVWPRINGQPVPVDTFYTNVFFVPLNSLGVPQPAPTSDILQVYPCPARNEIMLSHPRLNKAGYVRIYDALGQFAGVQKFVPGLPMDISFLAPGQYRIETTISGRSFGAPLLVY